MNSPATSAKSTATGVPGACPHDCPDTCATLITVENGRATRIAGDPDHPFTQGFLCTKVNRYLERTYHAERVLTPLRRVGPKGRGEFVEATWEEALDAIATRLNEIARSADGPQSILPYSYAGTMGMCMTVGASIGADAESVPESDLILLWGTNTLTSNPHLWPHILKARAKDAPVICIDPIRTRTAEQCDEWIAIRPGTDAALAPGMMHVLFAEHLQDDDYIERYTLGADKLRARGVRADQLRSAASRRRRDGGAPSRVFPR